MGTEGRIWSLVTAVLVAALPALISAYVTFRLQEQGSIPEKRVELQMIGPFDPLSDLASLGDRVNMNVSIDAKSYNNISAWILHVRNAGKVPILPTDIYESFTLAVSPPWAIVSVDDEHKGLNTVHAKWNRRDERTFVADPLLLNPGDNFSYRVYVTHTHYERVDGRDNRELRDLPPRSRTHR